MHNAVLDRAAGNQLLEQLQEAAQRAATFGPLEELVPGFADWIVTSLFGGTYQREGLSLRDRQLLNLAALAALGGVEPQLAGHIRTSRRIGMTATEIAEVFVHLAPYVGMPKAVAGLRLVTAVLAEETS